MAVIQEDHLSDKARGQNLCQYSVSKKLSWLVKQSQGGLNLFLSFGF